MIRHTMTEEMIQWEKDSGLFGEELLKKLHNVEYTETNGKVELTCRRNKEGNINFEGGATSQFVASNIMSEVDRQTARNRNLKLKSEGTTAIERLRKINKKITSGNLHLEGRQCMLDTNLMNELQRKQGIVDHNNLEKTRRSDLQYMKTCHNADEVVKKYGNCDLSKWTSKADMKTYLKPLKQACDAKMPDDRYGLIQRFNEWKYRSRKRPTNDMTVLNEFETWLLEENTKVRGKHNK